MYAYSLTSPMPSLHTTKFLVRPSPPPHLSERTYLMVNPLSVLDFEQI